MQPAKHPAANSCTKKGLLGVGMLRVLVGSLGLGAGSGSGIAPWVM